MASYNIQQRQAERLKKSIAQYRNGIVPRNTSQFFFKQNPGKADMTEAALIEQYSRWVYICANRNSTRVASVPLRLYAATGPNDAPVRGSRMPKAVDREVVKQIRSNAQLMTKQTVRQADTFVEITQHPFLELMQQVNPDMTMFEMMELTEIYLELQGMPIGLSAPARHQAANSCRLRYGRCPHSGPAP